MCVCVCLHLHNLYHLVVAAFTGCQCRLRLHGHFLKQLWWFNWILPWRKPDCGAEPKLKVSQENKALVLTWFCSCIQFTAQLHKSLSESKHWQWYWLFHVWSVCETAISGKWVWNHCLRLYCVCSLSLSLCKAFAHCIRIWHITSLCSQCMKVIV